MAQRFSKAWGASLSLSPSLPRGSRHQNKRTKAAGVGGRAPFCPCHQGAPLFFDARRTTLAAPAPASPSFLFLPPPPPAGEVGLGSATHGGRLVGSASALPLPLFCEALGQGVGLELTCREAVSVAHAFRTDRASLRARPMKAREERGGGGSSSSGGGEVSGSGGEGGGGLFGHLTDAGDIVPPLTAVEVT